MRANDLIIAIVQPNGIITLEGMHCVEVQLVGASFGSMLPMHRFGNSANIAIDKGQTGMIVLHCCWHRSKTPELFDFISKVDWPKDSDKPYIELNRQWAPEDPKRLIRHNWDSVEVSVDGVVYSSHKDAVRDGNIPASADLICRYADSKITVEEFLTAANTPTTEQKLRGQLKSAEVIINLVRNEANEAKRERDYWKYHGLQLAKAARPSKLKRFLLWPIPDRFRNWSLHNALFMFKNIPDDFRSGIYTTSDIED